MSANRGPLATQGDLAREQVRRRGLLWFGEVASRAALCAARCFLDGDAESASSAASLAVDAAFGVAVEELGLDPNDFAWDPAAEPAMPLARENMHPRVQGELRRQLEDLALLDERGATPENFRALRLRGAQP